jgi:hypothetical protein
MQMADEHCESTVRVEVEYGTMPTNEERKGDAIS